jgi:hypothetical protein
MSSQQLDDCYQYIIGLSRSTCECNEDDRPSDYNVSDSGLYLDELEGLNLQVPKSGVDCNNTSLWQIMEDARQNAIADFKVDALSCISSKVNLRRKPYKGAIGEAEKLNSTTNASYAYHGMRVRLADIVGGYMKIKKIGICLTTTGTIDMDIYSNESETPVDTVTLNTVANQLTWTDIDDIIIDMAAPSGFDNAEYSFLYASSGTKSFRNSQLSCDCGNVYQTIGWNYSRPTFKSETAKGKYGWADWAMAAGVAGTTLSERYEWNPQRLTQGVLLEVEFGCNGEKMLCNEEMDYTGDPWAMTIAKAIQYRAGERTYEKVLSSDNINQHTTATAESLARLKAQWGNAYRDITYNFICDQMARAENVNVKSDCFICNENQILQAGILI